MALDWNVTWNESEVNMTDLCCCISCLSLNYLVRFAWLRYFPPSRLTQSKAVGNGGQRGFPLPPPSSSSSSDWDWIFLLGYLSQISNPRSVHPIPTKGQIITNALLLPPPLRFSDFLTALLSKCLVPLSSSST